MITRILVHQLMCLIEIIIPPAEHKFSSPFFWWWGGGMLRNESGKRRFGAHFGSTGKSAVRTHPP